MTKTIKQVLLVVIVLMGIVCISAFALNRVFEIDCMNEIFEEVLSPDGDYKAVLFQRDCGATTGFSTQISLVPIASELPNDGGNVFIADGHPDSTMVEMFWSNSTTMIIRNATHIQTFKREQSLEGIQVIYK